MTPRQAARYRVPRVSIKQGIMAFLVFELVMFLLGYGLDIMFCQAVFFLSLAIGPIVLCGIVAMNARESDEAFESPVFWYTLAILGFAAFIVIVYAALIALSQGSIEAGLTLILVGIAVFFGAFRLIGSASRRYPEWRRMKAAQKMWCPACGARGPHEFDVCRRCGAVVFWAPSWLSHS